MEDEFDADKMEVDLDKVSRVRRPGAALHNLIMALFLLLGESHREMADWKTLADMLSQTEKSEKRPVLRMSEFEAGSVSRDQARLAKKLLAPLTVDKMKTECDAAAACFAWCKEKIQEVYEFRISRGSEGTRTGYYQDIAQWCSGVTEHKQEESKPPTASLGPRSSLPRSSIPRSSVQKCLSYADNVKVDLPDSISEGVKTPEQKVQEHEVEEGDLLVLKWLINNDSGMRRVSSCALPSEAK